MPGRSEGLDPLGPPAAESSGRPLAVCIDDVGLHAGVNRSAVALVQAGRVSSWSCMVDGHAFADLPAHVQTCQGLPLELGLHLNLTEALSGARVWPIRTLVSLAYRRRLPLTALTQEVRRQLDAFERSLGRRPDFVDGHQHVHQLPGVRHVLLAELNRRYAEGHQPWVRSCARVQGAPDHSWLARARAVAWLLGWRWGALPRDAEGKAWLVEQLGSADLARLARRQGVRQNRHLLGVRELVADEVVFGGQLASWLARAGAEDVLMVHPADGPIRPCPDALLATRQAEHAVLSSPAFGQLLARERIVVRPLSARI